MLSEAGRRRRLEVTCRCKPTHEETPNGWLIRLPAVIHLVEPERVALQVRQETHADDVRVLAYRANVVLSFEHVSEQLMVIWRDCGRAVALITTPAIRVLNVTLSTEH